LGTSIPAAIAGGGEGLGIGAVAGGVGGLVDGLIENTRARNAALGERLHRALNQDPAPHRP